MSNWVEYTLFYSLQHTHLDSGDIDGKNWTQSMLNRWGFYSVNLYLGLPIFQEWPKVYQWNVMRSNDGDTLWTEFGGAEVWHHCQTSCVIAEWAEI